MNVSSLVPVPAAAGPVPIPEPTSSEISPAATPNLPLKGRIKVDVPSQPSRSGYLSREGYQICKTTNRPSDFLIVQFTPGSTPFSIQFVVRSAQSDRKEDCAHSLRLPSRMRTCLKPSIESGSSGTASRLRCSRCLASKCRAHGPFR